MQNIAAIILAAGRGTRMKSELPKVLVPLHSRPMLGFVLETLKAAGVKKKILVLGYKAGEVKAEFPGIDTVLQKKLLGSGDAVKKAKNAFSGFKGDILVIYGDTPFIKKETIKELINKHKKEKASCTVLTARVKDPSGYGRILRDDTGDVAGIIEDRDTDFRVKRIDEINTGLYCFDKKALFSTLEKLEINKKKGEYYLTDVLMMLKKSGRKVSSVSCKDEVEAFGIDSKADLAEANEIMKKKVLESLMKSGVTIIDPNTTFIDMSAKIGADTVIHPNTVIEKDVVIGKNSVIGPFARIREHTVISERVEIGNFVELVRTKVSSGTKIKHLTYLGDAVVGKNVNIGAGTITANYDGRKKNRTIIADGASIGVGAILIAPLKIGKNAFVGAGSVVLKNKNVPAGKTVVGVPARVLKKRRSYAG